MKEIVLKIHEHFNNLERHSYITTSALTMISGIPKNGIYVFFENGELFEGMDRIVRVGTHTGDNQLLSRLRQHLVNKNKNRSIFRKNIGRAFLEQEKNKYLKIWDMDTTSRINKEKNIHLVDQKLEAKLEEKISEYMQKKLTFSVIEVNNKRDRLLYESKIASTLNKSQISIPSENWLGNYSPKVKIKNSGLWQVNELNKQVFTDSELDEFLHLINQK